MFKRNYYSRRRRNFSRGNRIFNNKIRTIKDFVIKIRFIILFFIVIFVIFFTSIFKVKKIIVIGNKTIESSRIQNIVINTFNRKKLKIFNNNLFLVNSDDIKNTILGQFNNINTVNVEKKFPKTIKILIKEKPTDILWCNKIKIDKISNNKKVFDKNMLGGEIQRCYLSDENGIIYKKIDNDFGSDSTKVFRDNPIEIGTKISDENLKNFIRKIFYSFNRKTGLTLSYLYFPSSDPRELHLITNKGMKIFFDLNRPVEGQISDLSAFVKNEFKVNDSKDMNYDYIDLRIIDRIIVKPRG